MITYNRLWNQLGMKGISQYRLIRYFGFSPSQLARLRHNQSVTTSTLDAFCEILDCRLDDIAEYSRDRQHLRTVPRKRNARHR